MTRGTFGARVEDIAMFVGEGTLVGRVTVDQVYARYQHERLDLFHPRGGGPGYLRNPLFRRSGEFLNRLASRLSLGRGGLAEAMGWSMEQLCSDVAREAPVEFSDLRFSGAPRVMDEGLIVYDRPPIIGRLSKEQLQAKNRHRISVKKWGIQL